MLIPQRGLFVPLAALSPGAQNGFSYSTTKTSNNPGSSLSLTSYSVGDAQSNRIVIAGIAWYYALAATLDSVTIGGVSAKIIRFTSTGSQRCELWYAEVPSGTTADVDLIWSTSINGGCSCAVWYGYPSDTAPMRSVGSSAASGGLITASDIPIKSGGSVVAAFAAGSGGGSNVIYGWSGSDSPTKNAEGTANNVQYSYASFQATQNLPTEDFTADPDGTATNVLLAASWVGSSAATYCELTFVSESHDSSASSSALALPTGAQAGDLLILLDRRFTSGSTPAEAAPGTYTVIGSLGIANVRHVQSYRVLDGSEVNIPFVAGATTSNRVALCFRPSNAIANVYSSAINSQNTSGDPAVQTLYSTTATGAGSAVAIAIYVDEGASASISTRGMSPSKDGEVQKATWYWVAYKILSYSSGAVVTADMNDEGANNSLISFGVKVMS